jgi:CRP/FNR family transcriptional regulator, anaerobic regulatory protein
VPASRLNAELFPFIAGLTARSRNELTELVAVRVEARRQLLRRGDAVGGAYFVLSGSLRAHYITAEGRDATLYHAEPGGSCILALNATLNDEPYPAWVDAPTGSTFVRVPSELFHRLLDSEAPFRAYVFGAMSRRIFELMCTLEEQRSTQIEQRVARYLLKALALVPASEVQATQVSIAAELGTAREVVFRALRSLAQQGLVATARRRIAVLDRAGLARAAGFDASAENLSQK